MHEDVGVVDTPAICLSFFGLSECYRFDMINMRV